MTQTLKIFVSSPGDVGEERTITERVIERLRAEFGNRAAIQAFLWEHDAVRATETPQAQFIRPSQADIVICILWARLGTRLPEAFARRPDGSVYESGTAYEFEDAKLGYDATGRPHLLVYRKTAEPRISFRDPKQVQEHVDQFQSLERFFQRWFLNDDGSLKGAYTPFADADEFERKVYDHLRHILRQEVTGPNAGEAKASWHSGSPFRGLQTFEIEHAPIFFGRTRAISDVRGRFELQAAENRAFVLVLGMSGSGKSSLMRAGVVPTITRPGVVERVGFWRRCVLRLSESRGDLFEWLAQRIVGPDMLPEILEAGGTVAALADMLRTGPEHLPVLLRMALHRAAEAETKRQRLSSLAPGRLLLVFDQFEELFTLPSITPESRAAFVRLLDVLARAEIEPGNRGSLAWIGATMRSDFYHRLAEIPDLIALATGNGEYHLLPPRRQEVADIIRQPARAAGLVFETNDEGASLDAEIEDAAMQDPSALPLLQFLLEELYARRRDDHVLTYAAYEEIGGLEGALAHRAEEVFAGLAPEVQAALPGVLRSLVNLRDGDEDRPVGRTIPLDTFAAGSPERALVEAFLRSDARLLVVEGRADGAHLRVAHEALLSHWTRAKTQIDSERTLFRIRNRVQSSAGQWLTHQRADDYLLPGGGQLTEAGDLLQAWRHSLSPGIIEFIESSISHERQIRDSRLRRVRTIAVAMTGLAAISVSLGLWAYNERVQAIAHAEAARSNQRIALNAAETLVSEIARPLQYMAGVSILQVRGMLDQAEAIYRRLLQQSDQTAEVRYSQAVMLQAFAEAHGALGNKKERLKSATDARDILLQLAGKALPEQELRREIGRSHIAVGDAQRSLDATAQAMAAYQDGLQIRQALFDEHTGDTRHRRNLAVALERIGDIEQDEGRPDAAIERFTRALALLEDSSVEESVQKTWTRERAVLLNKIGDVQLDQDEPAVALAQFERSKRLIDAMQAENDSNLLLRQDLASAHEKLAIAMSALNRPDDALENINSGRRLLERLHLQDPANAVWRRSLAMAYNRTGDILLSAGYRTQARLAYDRALQIAKDAGADIAWQRDIAIAYERQANLAFIEGQMQEATALYEASLNATEARSDSEAASAAWQRELMIGHYSIGRVKLALGRSDEGAATLTKSIEAGDALLRRNPRNLRWQGELATILNEYAWLLATGPAVLRDPPSAILMAERAVTYSNRQSPIYLDTLATAHFANNEPAKAVAAGREALALRDRTQWSDDVWHRIGANVQLFEKSQPPSRNDAPQQPPPAP